MVKAKRKASPQALLFGKPLREQLVRLSDTCRGIDRCSFTFRTLEQAEDISRFLALCTPDPDRALLGIMELMVNAIEHGNLGIGFDQKAMLLHSGNWRQEIETRLKKKPYAERKASVNLIRNGENGTVTIVIRDEGRGFNWKQHMEIDEDHLKRPNGRGIAHANLISFDELVFNEVGNEVKGIMYSGRAHAGTNTRKSIASAS